ncbi:50S ribosomal protein L18 [Pseudoramibacter sp.]|jgi:large subunit ribosomal protein L18|uniref:50S ribosomal protein L18 n=1 Tax=Pseudoramibacter sp. TaxID=2034862 RepID=UPI0025F7A485|nr:50S ribosomal protein L18 [Pseudoramibacter sp.]MCH4072417.1 50S ribosomal protein L18 [Pseudoramibacter sp.]MCH4106188.1 50S ribosomal protein L18 [Pseudoramibacter sp.]
MIKFKDKNKVRQNRHLRVRRKISGTAERPRLCVFRSNKHIYAQVIDDVAGKTLVAASTVEEDIKNTVKHGGDKDAAKAVGEAVAKKALDAGIENVVFDRGGYIYTGRVKELAEAAREAGLKF